MVGDRLHGYTVEGVFPLPEFDATAAQFRDNQYQTPHCTERRQQHLRVS